MGTLSSSKNEVESSSDGKLSNIPQKFECWLATMDPGQTKTSCEAVYSKTSCRDELFDSMKECNEFLAQFPLPEMKKFSK